MNYLVKTNEFEGPLELLLSLIERRKLFINDISLAAVTDDYIAYVNDRENMPTVDVANFIVVAATLLLIKSKSLLPTMSLTEEEESDIAGLERRLKIYQRIQELSVQIKGRFGSTILFPPNKVVKKQVGFAPSEDTTLSNIVTSLTSLLHTLPKVKVVPQTVVKKVISIEEMIDALSARITKNLKMSFRDFAGTREEKVEMIVGFLAMLELVKQGSIRVEQSADFEDIQMESQEVSVPSYM